MLSLLREYESLGSPPLLDCWIRRLVQHKGVLSSDGMFVTHCNAMPICNAAMQICCLAQYTAYIPALKLNARAKGCRRPA